MGKTFDIPESFSIFREKPDVSTDTPCPGRLYGHTGDIGKWGMDDADRDKRNRIHSVLFIHHIPGSSFLVKYVLTRRTFFVIRENDLVAGTRVCTPSSWPDGLRQVLRNDFYQHRSIVDSLNMAFVVCMSPVGLIPKGHSTMFS
jgi:hypothetical protein